MDVSVLKKNRKKSEHGKQELWPLNGGHLRIFLNITFSLKMCGIINAFMKWKDLPITKNKENSDFCLIF